MGIAFLNPIYGLVLDFFRILIFNSFGVQKRYYKKILVWGILGAIVIPLSLPNQVRDLRLNQGGDFSAIAIVQPIVL